jgi:dihydroorotate dehydrogenase (NAD+) catalytic subunit
MAVTVGNLRMQNPLTVASGTFAAGREYADFVAIAGLGALTTKGVSAKPWTGNPGKRMYETASGLLNSIGLQNPGVEVFCADSLPWLAEHAPGLPVVVNVVGHSAREYVDVIERLEDEAGVSAYELNISCPNLDAGGMAFGTSAEAAAAMTAAARAATKRPLLVKLSPNVTDITELARAVEAAGADGLSLINTLLGLAIDVSTRRFVFERRVAGLSGPAVKPVALRMVWEVARAVDVPVIGMGGVSCGEDVVEFLLAGASAVAFGTANFANPRVFVEALAWIEDYCRAQDVRDVNELVGAVREVRETSGYAKG